MYGEDCRYERWRSVCHLELTTLEHLCLSSYSPPTSKFQPSFSTTDHGEPRTSISSFAGMRYFFIGILLEQL